MSPGSSITGAVRQCAGRLKSCRLRHRSSFQAHDELQRVVRAVARLRAPRRPAARSGTGPSRGATGGRRAWRRCRAASTAGISRSPPWSMIRTRHLVVGREHEHVHEQRRGRSGCRAPSRSSSPRRSRSSAPRAALGAARRGHRLGDAARRVALVARRADDLEVGEHAGAAQLLRRSTTSVMSSSCSSSSSVKPSSASRSGRAAPAGAGRLRAGRRRDRCRTSRGRRRAPRRARRCRAARTRPGSSVASRSS